MMNEAMREWGHQFVYDGVELTRQLESAGFREVVVAEWRKSTHGPLNGLESRPFHGEVILEGTK